MLNVGLPRARHLAPNLFMPPTMTALIEPFRAISISRLAHAMQARGEKVIHMEFGQPSTGAPKAGVFAEGAARAVAANIVVTITFATQTFSHFQT